VVVDTVHGWKGLEASHVYIPMPSTTFPNPRADIQDERRLAYVAIPRAQQSATILCPATDHYGREALPSQFVKEACVPEDVESDGEELVDPPEVTNVEGSAQRVSQRHDRWGDAEGMPAGWDPSAHISRAERAKRFARLVSRSLPGPGAVRDRAPVTLHALRYTEEHARIGLGESDYEPTAFGEELDVTDPRHWDDYDD